MTDAIDITASQRKTVRSLLERHLPDVEVWVYGSRANWTAKPASDLDMVVFTSPEQSRKVAELKEAFEESSLPFRVDLFVWDEIPDSFKANIKKQHVVLQRGGDAPSLYSPQFPASWDRHSLHDLADWINGLAFRNVHFTPTGKPVVKIAEIKNGLSGQTKYTEAEYDEKYRLLPGDMLFSWSGQPETSIDAFWWRGPEGWLNQHIFKVLPKDACDRTFFYYLLKYLKPHFIRIAHNKQTTGLGHVTKSDLQRMEVAVPKTKKEQKAIAHILGTLDDKIELNRRMNETLEGIARTIFKSWFIDFDPVRAKAEGLDTGLPKEIEDLFPDCFDDSELGAIPKGWEEGTLAELTELNPETWKPATAPEHITYVDLANTKNGVINSTQDFNFRDAPSRARRILRSGDTIVGTVRPGNRSFAYVSSVGLTGSTGFAVLRPKAEVAREFVYLSATRKDSIDHLAHLADGAAYPAVRPDVVHSLECTVPASGVLAAFHAAVAPLFAGMGRIVECSQSLDAAKDHLLPALLSGRVPVPLTQEAAL